MPSYCYRLLEYKDVGDNDKRIRNHDKESFVEEKKLCHKAIHKVLFKGDF